LSRQSRPDASARAVAPTAIAWTKEAASVRDDGPPALEHLHAIAMLAPAVVLLWPGRDGTLAGDPQPELTGAAIAALATVPALLLALLRGVRASAPWSAAFAGFAAVQLIAMLVHAPSDTLEASRAMLLLTTAFALLVCGATLGEVGCRTLARGSTVLTLFALIPALFGVTQRYSGMLGNTGSTSEVALIGAVAGAWMFVEDETQWRWLGGLAALAQATYCGVAPVFAGALVVRSRGRRFWSVLLGIALGVAFFGGSFARSVASELLPDTSPGASRDTGGASVRALIWKSTLSMVGEHALLGVGPGQFAVEFPPFRESREIEISSHDRQLAGQETEVEHAHDDYLQAFADAGAIGGLAFLAFVGAVAWRAWRALRARDMSSSAIALAALAVLANSVLREPLLWNPASSSVAFAVFGALLGSSSARPLAIRIAPALIALAAIAVQAPRALRIARLGSALSDYLVVHDDSTLARARAACPDSVAVRSIDARAASGASAIVAWNSVLALRPHRFEALVDLGIEQARLGHAERARELWKHALEVDPSNPDLPRNFARMEALIGDVDESVQWCERVRFAVPEMFRQWATEAIYAFDLDRGRALLARASDKFAQLDAEHAYQLSRDETLKLPERTASALQGLARIEWARQQAISGATAESVRSYRQAKRNLQIEVNPEAPQRWAPRLRLELAAALCLDKKAGEARRELDSVEFSTRDVDALPKWAGDALRSEGLLAAATPSARDE
jgi:O-antigen ligase